MSFVIGVLIGVALAGAVAYGVVRLGKYLGLDKKDNGAD
jgi:high-affinity Fe2+/Pb2+ permease